MKRKVLLEEYDTNWKLKFEAIKEKLIHVFANEVISIEHFGSTSVESMLAKPIIDVLVIVKDINKVDSYNEEMLELGYIAKGENGIVNRRYFQKLADDGVNHLEHIHCYQVGNEKAKAEIMFRDYLRSSESARNKYSKLKLEAAKIFENDPEKYQEYKSNLIEQLTKEAKQFAKMRKTGIDCGFSQEKSWFRYRAAALIVEDGKVLLAGNSINDYLYSVGGAVLIGEKSEEAVVREVYEETGEIYEVDQLAIIHENFFPGEEPDFAGFICHEICFYYKMKSKGFMKFTKQGKTQGVEEKMHWVDIDQLKNIKAYPSFLEDYLSTEHDSVVHIITNELE